MSVAAVIEAKLTQAFNPERLVIEDQSHLHAGHAGHRPGGESHFRVELVSARFTGLNRVARQRLVYDALAAELAGPIHAMALKTLAPGE